jgi:hypothetical protein
MLMAETESQQNDSGSAILLGDQQRSVRLIRG